MKMRVALVGVAATYAAPALILAQGSVPAKQVAPFTP